MKAPTIYDVAAAAGVSHQTVTRYLRGFTGIRPETQARVERAIAELDYRPNLAARSLKSGRSHRIGALTHETAQVGPHSIAEGTTAAAREAGYVLDLVSLDMRSPASVAEAIGLLGQQDLAGILVLASTDDMADALASADFRVPVLIAAESAEPSAEELAATGVPALVAHLVELGHARIGMITGADNWSASRNRTRALVAALADQGLEPTWIRPGDWSARSGYEAVAGGAGAAGAGTGSGVAGVGIADDAAGGAVAGGGVAGDGVTGGGVTGGAGAAGADRDVLDGATAIIAANDQTALGAMLALKERGLRIPDDVSVVGVDDIPEAAYFDPPLTTVHNDFALQGRHALHQLMALIDPARAATVEVPAPRLVLRRSSGPAPA